MPTPATSPRPIRMFVAYAREDDAFRRELIDTLADWKRDNLIESIWSDREILPGEEWDHTIEVALDSADLILLLMSRKSIASEYMAGKEIVRALERHERGEARVVPMVVRSCDWQSTKLAKLQVIPRGGTPLSKYSDPDDFWLDVRNELKAVVRELQKHRGDAAAVRAPATEVVPPTQTTQATDPALGEVRTNFFDGQPYLWISPGEFLMGASPGDDAALEREKPQHRVQITRGFWIGKTPVTVNAYRRFVAAKQSQMPPEPGFAQTGEHPVVKVSWNDAVAYCQWAGGRQIGRAH